jgi:8-oxo-dGTP pyrophosphatase MutT (NUDIX family)
MPWPVKSSRTVYENQWIRVREDIVETPGGAQGVYGVMTVHHPAVFVVALTDNDEVLLVDVDRHTVGPSLEVPAGGSDGEDPIAAARRELLEETGHRAEHWLPLGTLHALNGVCEAPEHFFLARGLTLVTEDNVAQTAEGISSVRRVPVAEVLAMVGRGEISDGESVAALMLTLTHLGRVR